MTNYRNQQNTLPDTELCKPNWCEYSDKNSKIEMECGICITG